MNDQVKTLPVGIEQCQCQCQFTFLGEPSAAATVLAVIPLVVLILTFQRRLITGLTASAVK